MLGSLIYALFKMIQQNRCVVQLFTFNRTTKMNQHKELQVLIQLQLRSTTHVFLSIQAHIARHDFSRLSNVLVVAKTTQD